MNNILRGITGLIGVLFFGVGLQWILDPSTAAESLGMPLLQDVGLSTQIGDLGSFFITLGSMTLIGVYTKKQYWFLAPAMLLLVAAFYRSMSTVFYDATFATPQILVEVVVGLFLLFVRTKISGED